jgi:hypothetical protein
VCRYLDIPLLKTASTLLISQENLMSGYKVVMVVVSVAAGGDADAAVVVDAVVEVKELQVEDVVADADSDAGADAGADSGADAGADAGVDVVADAGVDVVAAAGVDVVADAGVEAFVEVKELPQV